MIFRVPTPRVAYGPDSIIAIWCWGQSNMLGSVTAQDVPAPLQGEMEGVYTFVRNVGVVPYHAGVNSHTAPGPWGPEAEMARRLRQATGKEIYIVKYALGGTGLSADAGLDWKEEGELADQALSFLRGAEGAMLAQHGKHCAWRAIVSMQGENDCSTSQKGAAYEANYRALLARFAAATHLAAAPIVGRVSSTFATGSAGGDDVRAAQLAIGSEIGAAMVDTDDIELQVDNVHYSPAGLVELGRRFAAAVLPFVLGDLKSISVPPPPVDNPPSAPANLVAAEVTDVSVLLAWDEATDDFGVSVYRIFRDGVQIDTTPSTSYYATGLTVSTQYDFWVVAVDTAGQAGPASNTVSPTTLAAIPSELTYNATTAKFAAPDGHEYIDMTYAGLVRWGGRPNTAAWPVVTVNSWAALQAAVSTHNSQNSARVIEIVPGTYAATGHIKIEKSNLVIRPQGGVPASVRFEHNSQNGGAPGTIWIEGNWNFTNLTSTSSVRTTGQKTMVVPGHSYVAGDWIYYSCVQPSDVVGHYRSGGSLQSTDWVRAVNQVESVSGDTITFKKPIRVRHPEAIQFKSIRKYTTLVQNVGIEGLEMEWADPGGAAGFDAVHHNACVLCWVWDCRFIRPVRHSLGHGYRFSSNLDYRRVYAQNPWRKGGGGNGYYGLRNTSDGLFVDCEGLDNRHGFNSQEHCIGGVYFRSRCFGSDSQHHSRFVSWTAFDNCEAIDDTDENASFRGGYLTPGVAEHDSASGDNNLVFRSGFARSSNDGIGMALGILGLHNDNLYAYSRFHSKCRSWTGYSINASFGILVEDFVRNCRMVDCTIYTSNNSECWALGFAPGFVPHAENPSNWGYVSPNNNHPVRRSKGASGWSGVSDVPSMNAAIYRPSTSDLRLENVTFRGFNPSRRIAGGLNDPDADPATVLHPASTYSFDDTAYTLNQADFDPANIPVPAWTVQGSLYLAQLAYHGLSL